MAERRRIAVVGASVRAAAFSLLRQGYAVVAADLFADADLRRVCPVERVTNYPYELADWLARTECDEWLYTGALENYPDLVDQMAALRPLRGNAGSVLRAVRDPLLLQETLTEAGLGFPKSRKCDGKPPGAGNWLHKTGQGASGSGVSEFDPNSHKLPTDGYWQRHLPGTSGSAVFLASEQASNLLGVTRQLVGEEWTGARQFQYCGTLAPWLPPRQAITQLARMGEEIAMQFSLRGMFGVDFILDGQAVWPVEVNPRTTAAVEIIERTVESQLHVGKIVLYAKHPLAVSRATSEKLLHRAGPFEIPQLADIPNGDTHIALGEPILTVFAEGDSLSEVEAKLHQSVANLEAELYGSLMK